MTDVQEKAFKRAQWRFILCSMIAYAFFYITRKNLSMAQPEMLEQGVITKEALGTILTVHGVLYGVSRFVNGKRKQDYREHQKKSDQGAL